MTPFQPIEQKPVAVMIHGAGGGGWEWDAWRPVFEKAGWEVVAPDLVPAKGGLAKTSLGDYVHQVVSWSPKGRPFVLIGASMGGPLALKAALQTDPKAVVLVNGVSPHGNGGKKFPAVVRWAGGPLKDTRDSMPDSDEATIQKAWHRWRDESGAVMTTLSKGTNTPRPPAPILVVIGTADTDVSPESGRALAREYGADRREFLKMSHVGPLLGRRAPEVAADVIGWLKSIR